MHPHDPAQQPTAAPFDNTRGLLVAAAAMGVTATLLVVKWLLTMLFGGAGGFLVIVLAAGLGAYLWFRKRDPLQARAIEARLQQFTRSAVTQISTGTAGSPQQQPVAPQQTYAATQYGVLKPAPTTSADGLISALLLLPSLLGYGLVYGSVSFGSVWQPWWIINGLNLFFLMCIIGRARSAPRRTAALLPGLAGLVLVGLATSPSPDANLVSIFSTRQWSSGYSYMAPLADLLPWLSRAPHLAVVLFVIAWGIARRQGSWAVGLIPAALMVWWSIWYRENEFTGEAGWIGFWALDVGVFIAGCLACWAVGAVTRRSAAQPLSRGPY